MIMCWIYAVRLVYMFGFGVCQYLNDVNFEYTCHYTTAATGVKLALINVLLHGNGGRLLHEGGGTATGMHC